MLSRNSNGQFAVMGELNTEAIPDAPAFSDTNVVSEQALAKAHAAQDIYEVMQFNENQKRDAVRAALEEKEAAFKQAYDKKVYCEMRAAKIRERSINDARNEAALQYQSEAYDKSTMSDKGFTKQVGNMGHGPMGHGHFNPNTDWEPIVYGYDYGNGVDEYVTLPDYSERVSNWQEAVGQLHNIKGKINNESAFQGEAIGALNSEPGGGYNMGNYRNQMGFDIGEWFNQQVDTLSDQASDIVSAQGEKAISSVLGIAQPKPQASVPTTIAVVKPAATATSMLPSFLKTPTGALNTKVIMYGVAALVAVTALSLAVKVAKK